MIEMEKFKRTLDRARKAFRPGLKTPKGRAEVLVSLSRRAGALGIPVDSAETIREKLSASSPAEFLSYGRNVVRALSGPKGVKP